MGLPGYRSVCGGGESDGKRGGLMGKETASLWQAQEREGFLFSEGMGLHSRGRRSFQARAPRVLRKSLYGNDLITHVVMQHYGYGVPLGRMEAQLGIGYGSLMASLHRVSGLLRPVIDKLIDEYRQAPLKHADEISWRTDGQNGYVWLFCTPNTSLFRFRKTRSASVAKEVFGEEALPGDLVVDRYQAYNRAPCQIQYCYAHLLRDVKDLQKEFPDDPEV